jgi:AraC-like DNA-binding protein
MLKKKDKKHVAEIEELNTKNEQEVHEARIKFMTISDSDNAFLKKLEEVIERNFSDPNISVDFLASEMNVSRSGLFAKVKALADITPNEMIQIIRLKHAARLLETKEYRVNEICYMVGFNSPSYFAKCFQKHFGTKPAEYAK